MKIAQLGEFNLIDRLASIAAAGQDSGAMAWRNLVTGIGDDAAVWRSQPGRVLATTDCLVQGVHFSLETTSWRDLGWKSLAVSLSDIAAMGGSPRYALVTLALPPDSLTEDIEQLYQGMVELAGRYGVAIVGGDTSAAPLLFINLTVIGQAGRRLLTRSAARAGDLVAVTGHLGAAAGGLRLLQDKRQAVKADAPLRQAFLRPSPRLDAAEALVAAGVRCAIDISDGLLADLGHICHNSHVGAVVEAARVPLHPALPRVFGPDALNLALSGGEDYELVFTAPIRVLEQVRAASPCPVTIIGRITRDNSGNVSVAGPDGQPLSFNSQGWQHFAPHQP